MESMYKWKGNINGKFMWMGRKYNCCTKKDEKA